MGKLRQTALILGEGPTEFFIKTKGLHGYFERNGGSLEKAVANANRSVEEKQKNNRDYTYSELGRLMKELNGLG